LHPKISLNKTREVYAIATGKRFEINKVKINNDEDRSNSAKGILIPE